MKKIWKWLGFVVAGLIGAIAAGSAYGYFGSERELGREYTAAEILGATLPSEPGEIAEGARLARLAGCRHCHGVELTGFVPLDVPHVVRVVAPNLTTTVPRYSDAQLVGVIRRGVKLDNTSTWFMPADSFMHLRREDLARIVAYLRSVPPQTGITEKTEVRTLGRLLIATGKYKSSAAEAEDMTDEVAPDLEDPLSHGRYLVMSFCTECHGQDLAGRAEANAPTLAIAKGYSLEQFARLMHDGIGPGGRTFELMTPTAQARFAYLTPAEIEVIHSFLSSAPIR